MAVVNTCTTTNEFPCQTLKVLIKLEEFLLCCLHVDHDQAYTHTFPTEHRLISAIWSCVHLISGAILFGSIDSLQAVRGQSAGTKLTPNDNLCVVQYPSQLDANYMYPRLNILCVYSYLKICATYMKRFGEFFMAVSKSCVTTHSLHVVIM